MGSFLIYIVVLGVVSGERTWLKKLSSFPGPHEMKIVHYFTIDARKSPTISVLGPVLLNVSTPNVMNEYMQVSVVHTSAMEKVFVGIFRIVGGTF